MKTKQHYYIMGYGKLGNYLREFFANVPYMLFCGFIDNNATKNNVYKPEEIENRNAIIYIASINYAYEITHQLKNLGFNNVINFAELTLKYPKLQEYNQAFLGLKDDYECNKEKYKQLREILVDEKSKEVLDTIIEFRKTYNINLYSKIADNINNQYFENFMPKREEVFIDGGGYDGDTILRAINCGYKFKKIYFFEPDKTSFKKAKENLKIYNNIEYFPFGLSDKNKILAFESDGSFGAHFSTEGKEKVKCISLDETIKESKAYIKLDIEGAEIDAINGAQRLLKNISPFAICVYHKPSDVWKIPKRIIEICGKSAYKFYLRHYTNTIFDTILYGVPNQKVGRVLPDKNI